MRKLCGVLRQLSGAKARQKQKSTVKSSSQRLTNAEFAIQELEKICTGSEQSSTWKGLLGCMGMFEVDNAEWGNNGRVLYYDDGTQVMDLEVCPFLSVCLCCMSSLTLSSSDREMVEAEFSLQ
jgi:hypothetical protein